MPRLGQPLAATPSRDGAFVSSSMTAAGVCAVGVSGTLQSLRDGDRGALFALASWETPLRDAGEGSGFFGMHRRIPRMKLVLVEDLDDPAKLFARYVAASGVSVSLIARHLDLRRTGGIVETLLDPRLVRNDDGTGGLRVAPFEVEVSSLVPLQPGETVVLEYWMLAHLASVGHETADGIAGGHVFVGDPFDLTASAQGKITVPGVSAVPLPGMSGRLAVGVFTLWLRARRARHSGLVLRLANQPGRHETATVTVWS